MLESLVANLLNRFLGMYVQNFDPKQLNVGIWSGDVTLRNLELRREALDQLKLPLNVVEGHLGLLTMSIPWSNLRGKPVKVNIEDVFLLAAPREDADINPEEEERRAHAVKMEKLDSAELLKERNTEGMSQEEQKKNQSFTASLTTAIVDNVQISVKNIHIRYEDSISDPGHPFALGFTLGGFDAVSTDENWRPTFIQSTSSTTHKLASLESLAVYWDTDAKLLSTGKGSQQGIEHDEFLKKFKSLSVKDENGETNHEAHQFILKPVTGRAGLEMDKTGKVDRPKIKAKLLFDELGFVLDDDQYRDALMLVDLFHYFIRHQEYKKFQPKSKVSEDPQAWLRFAGQAVLDKIHDRNKRWSWAYFKERRDDRIRYIELFKKRKKEEKLTAEETADIDGLEHKLVYEDLRFWRSLARNQLRKENAGVKKPAQKQTWTQWAWGKHPTEEASDDSQISDQQRKELYEAINFDEKQQLADAVEMPKEYIKMQVDLSLRTGSFTLKRDPHGKETEILKLLFDNFKTQFSQRTASLVAKVSLEGMRLYDGTTPGNLFPQMITIKDAPQIPDDERVKDLGDDEEETNGAGVEKRDAKQIMEAADEEPEDPFFQLEFENNPLDDSADMALNLKLKGMEFVYNPAFVIGIVKFFRPPERHMESIGALMESAGKTVEAVRQQTRAGLEFALEEHKTLNAKLDITAPLIIVPNSVTEKSTICLIVDAGHASVTSELVDKDTLNDVRSKQRQKLSEEEYQQLEGLMYDKFNLQLTSTQVLIGTTIEETRAKLNSKESNFHLVDKINVDFLVETCIVPKGTSLTKFRLSGHLPVLHASISDQKYKSLMKVIDFAIPKFDDDDQSNTKAEHRKSVAGSVPQTAKEDDERRKSFSFAAQRHDIALEDEMDNGDAEHIKDTKAGKQSDVSVEQKNIEIKFTVDKLQGSLYRADAEGKKADQLLAELIAENFILDFYQRPFDMAAEVRLGTLAVEDHVEEDPLPEFRNIIETEKVEGEDLFQLKFVRVNKDSPEFTTKYEGIATNLDVQVSTINVIVTRRTLLTLLDFVLLTFTNPGAPQEEPAAIEDSVDDSAEVVAPQTAQEDSDKIRVRADLKRIAVVLNNDGIRLATLGLNTAKVSVFLMGKTMRIGAHLGDLDLIDDVNQGASEDSSFRRLVTIQGDELAHFSYETYDDSSEAYPGYDTSIYLRAGSLKINFVTEPFRKIMEFGVKFGKMQAIFNAARQAAANQATQLQQKASRLHFDIVVSTPIVVFPRLVITDQPERDTLTAELGEIYASNGFVPLEDSEHAQQANKIEAGIRNVRLLTSLHYDDEKEEELQMIEKLNLDFKINMVDHETGSKRPDLEIEGASSDLNLKITQQQLQLLLEMSKTIPAAFATEPDDEVQEKLEEELPAETVEPAKAITSDTEDEKRPMSSSSLGPELGTDKDNWTKLDLVFKIGEIGLELIKGKGDEPIGDIKAQSLSQFSLNDTSVKLRMISDGALESELLIQSLSIRDTRQTEQNKFRKIMSLINTDVKQQFMASVSISGGDERTLIALLTIDSPRVIFSLDYVFALKSWVDGGLATEEPIEIAETNDEDDTGSTSSFQSNQITRRKSQASEVPSDEVETAPDSGMGVNFRVNIVDAQVVLIANPAITTSEAIVLGTKQVLVAKQHAMTLQVDKVGMFLCRMDKFEDNRLRILDDFSIQTSLDMRSQGEKSSLTSIHVNIEPLVLRLSLRDILLAMQIVNRASASSSLDDKQLPTAEAKKISASASNAPAGSRMSVAKPASTKQGAGTKTINTTKSGKSVQASPAKETSAVLTREEMNVTMAGIRVVLIGDKHELPMLDWSVKNFGVDVRDWSSNLTADTRLETFFNIYNFSKSAWEPLVEPWSLGFHMSKDTSPEKLSVEFYSKKNLELTVSSATIALASKSFDFLSSDEDVLSKPRGLDAPYRIRNHTGFDINVWAENKDDDEGSAAKMEDGQEIPWRFEDAMTMRETLSSEAATGIVGVKLEDSGFNSVEKITVSREGEKVYNLYPKKDKIQHRLLVEVKLGTDNIKYITLRSPLLVENNTQIPVEIGVYSPEDGNLLKIEKIAPGDARPAPVGAAYMHSLIVRPDQGFGYTWSREGLFWRDLLKRRTRTLTCRPESDGEDSPSFYFQMHASFDEKNPLTKSYPYMRIKLHAPVEIQNLLPFDFQYRMFDHNTKKDWKNFLRKGGVSPVHVVELTHLLMLSVDMQDTPFRASEFTVINSNDRENFRRERTLVVKDNKDLTLRLKLHYFTIPDSGGAFKVTVYAPYLLLNRTGLELDIKSKQFLGATKAAAGQSDTFVADEGDEPRKPKPIMFNFPTDDTKNRAMLKVGDTQWSKPQSFDAIGSTYSVTLGSSTGRRDMDVGVSVEEGEGKYHLTKIVTIAPRFVVKNKLGEDINLREPGSSDILTIEDGKLLPLRYLRQAASHQLSLCYPGVNNAWSSPFEVANVGSMHVKLAKAKQRQKLIRVDVLMENATIFLHLSVETKHWPFSMRNESNQEFLFWQANPNVDDDDEDTVTGWKPIRYRLPPRSIMPYAWDYPAAKRKEIILSANKKEKAVKLAEIGNPPPMRIPPNQENPRGLIIDLNIAADGPAQSLILSNFKQSKSLYKQKSATGTNATGFEIKDMDMDVTFSARLAFAGIGISLVNRQLRELVYLTLRDIELKYTDSPVYQTVKATIKWIQLDNQLYGGIFPIIFYPSVVPKTGKEMEAHPILHTAVTKVKDDSYGVLYIKYFTILLQQMTLEIDEDFIFALLDFAKIPGASWSEPKEGKLSEDELQIPEPTQEESGQDIYFELLHLQPMQFDISFVRTERINAEEEAQSTLGGNPLMFMVNVITMSIGNVNDAPIRFNALMLENARVSTGALTQSIKTHYVQESLRQVHIVIGSADFLGNPVGLFNNLSAGVQDIFYEPYQGLIMTDRPQDLGIGIAKGASSFVKKSVFGFSDSVAKFTGSVGKGLAAASMDKEFENRRRMTRSRNRPKHALYGITYGGNALAESVASGFGGLARMPMQGAEKEGAFGFAKGVAKGFIGLATKPAIGAFDLASSVAEGVRNTTTVFDQDGLDRVRLTRFIGTDGVVRPYSQREALGQFWLKTLDSGKYFHEDYIAHLELSGKDLMVMLTYNNIVLVKTKRLVSEWDVPLKDVQTISKERTGIGIFLKGGVSGPFLPVGEEESRNWLYRMIAVAVNAFNERYGASG